MGGVWRGACGVGRAMWFGSGEVEVESEIGKSEIVKVDSRVGGLAELAVSLAERGASRGGVFR